MVELTASGAPIANPDGTATVDFRTLLQQILETLNALGVGSIAAPTGTGANTAINMNWTTAVSNPPTQAEVTAIRDQVVILSKVTGRLIADLKQAGVIG